MWSGEMADISEVCRRLRDMIDMAEASERKKRSWERQGTSRWGFGVALDIVTLERRLAALEKLSPNSYAETDAKRGVSNTNHDAAPATRAEDVLKEPTGRSGGEPAGGPKGTVRTGNTRDPGDGWRLLESGEVIRDGDEFYTLDGWKRTYCHRHQPDPDMTYRRRKTAPPCVETDGPSSRKCVSPAADIGQATGGRGQNTQQPHAAPRECSGPVGYAVVLASGRIYTRCDFEFEAKAIADALPVAEGVQATVAGLYLLPTLTDAEREAIERGMCALDGANYSEPPNGWIRASERMPDAGKVVLAWLGGRVVFGYCRDGAWIDTLYGWTVPNGPTHWMPLPDPPEVQ